MRVDVGSCALEVEDHGEGLPVILVHGFPLSSEIFSPLRPAIEQVARLVTPDLRGFGASDKPAGEYSMDVLAADVLAVADRLGLERFVLGGHSMGGYAALRFAALHRERLVGLILIDTRAEADTPEGASRREAAVARIRSEGGEGYLDEFVPGLVGPATHARAPRFVRELRSLAGDVPDHVLIACQQAMQSRPDATELLATLTMPALVIVGEEDAITPVESARKMAAALPHASLAIIPGAGHTPSVERPIPTADAIVTFLRALATPISVITPPRASRR